MPVQPAWRLADCPEQQRWLIDGLWSEEAVGIIGGEPKCCKSFLALDLAVAVAAGIPCLRRFTVTRPGRVLLYPAEDALHVVRRRLEGICAAAGVSLTELDAQVITGPSLRLDLEADRARLDETVARRKPRLLVLDPFVRLHRIDENVSGDAAPLLAFLRDLQRRHAIAVAVVHHARKGAGAIPAGQALRGSSEFHAWGDSNLYIRCDSDDRIVLNVEHRAAAAMPGVTLELTQRDDALALEPVQADPQPESRIEPTSVDDRITAALAECVQPRPFSELRASCRVRTSTLYGRLAAMIAAGLVVKSADGYCLAARCSGQMGRSVDRVTLDITISPNLRGSCCARPLPTSASGTLYSRREAEAGTSIKKRDKCTINHRARAHFLGFAHICAKSRNGRFLLRRQSMRKRTRAKLAKIKEELRRRLHQSIAEHGQWLTSVVAGYFAYHAVPTNGRSLSASRYHVIQTWLRSLRRRSQRKNMPWDRMNRIIDAWMPPVVISHPWPNQRFDVKYPRQEPSALAAHARICAGRTG